MEPVIAKSGQDADETDSVKVCVCLPLYVNLFFFFLYIDVFTQLFFISCAVSSTSPTWVCFCPLLGLCVFLLLQIWWAVNLVLRLLGSLGLFMSPFLLLFSVVSFMMPWVGVNVSWLALHPFVCGWVLIWSCLLLFYCCIDIPTRHLCTFKASGCLCVRVHSRGAFIQLCVWIFASILSVCAFGLLSFPDPQPPPNKTLMKGTKQFGHNPLTI